jgi:iron complex outermembrane recepter protein
MRTTRVILTTSIAAIAITLVPPFAQLTSEETEAHTGGEIIVTARRKNERLIDVPASVTVLSADTQINIRGINGACDAESSMALVVDGILKTNTAQLNRNQGTLR